MLIAIRFIPIIFEEVHRVRQAMHTRGASASFYRALVVPVMVRIITISDTLALSLETRAFELDNKHATVYHPVYFTMRDFIYVVCIFALIIGMVVLA